MRSLGALGWGGADVGAVVSVVSVSVSVVSVSVSVPGGWVAAGWLRKICFCVAFKAKTHFF